MDIPITAHLSQNPDGVWSLWVIGEVSGQQTPLPAAEPGKLPGLAARAAALASLGYEPADPDASAGGWAWEETPNDHGSRLDGTITVRALPSAGNRP